MDKESWTSQITLQTRKNNDVLKLHKNKKFNVKNTCVCETLYPWQQQSWIKLFLAQRSQSRSQGHQAWCHFERTSLVEYPCQIQSLYILQLKTYSEG